MRKLFGWLILLFGLVTLFIFLGKKLINVDSGVVSPIPGGDKVRVIMLSPTSKK